MSMSGKRARRDYDDSPAAILQRPSSFIGPRRAPKWLNDPAMQVKRARATGWRIAQKFPYKDWGRVMVPRGTPAGEAKYGETFYNATPEQRSRREADGYYGRGRYSIGSIARGIGRAASTVGRVADVFSGNGVYTGRGAYANSLMSSEPASVITSAADETGAVTVNRREFLTEVYGPGETGSAVPFEVLKFALNPGLEKSFPWLSQIAQNYEEYELDQLVFSFRSTTTDIGNSTSGQCGTVIMATAYNPSSAPFGEKSDMMGYDGAMSCKTTESMHHGVECDPNKLSGSAGKFVRAFALDSTKDIKDYDHGLFQLAIANAPDNFAGRSLGELWVSYTVKLRKPKYFTARGLNINRDIYVTAVDPVDNSYPLGNAAQTNLLHGQSNNIGTKLDISLNSVAVVFPADYSGVVQIDFVVEGQNLAMTRGAAPELTGNVSEYKDMYSALTTTDQGPGFERTTSTSFLYLCSTRYRISASTGGVDNIVRLRWSSGGGSTVQQGTLEINEINSGFSFRYANLGPSDAPILVDANGTLATPI